MNIISIGWDLLPSSHTAIAFGSQRSLLDAELVLWNPSSLLVEYGVYSDGGVPKIGMDESVRFVNDLARRRREMMSLLDMGRTLAIVLPQPLIFEYWEKRLIERKTSLPEILPLEGIRTHAADGMSLEFRGTGAFTSFWERVGRTALFPVAYLESPSGTPFCFLKGTQFVAGSHLKVRAGHVILLPSIRLPPVRRGEKPAEILEALRDLVRDLQGNSGELELPEWSENFQLPTEVAQRGDLARLEQELQTLTDSIIAQKQKIADLDRYKLLFTGSGRALELQVARVFEALGFEVAEGMPGRDDLILRIANKVAVVEVKGVKGSAAERNAAQLEKWVSEFHLQNDVRPKGILIVNAFKDTPLTERIETPFPAQMLPYSVNRGHCLLTGIQLLCMYLEVSANPERKADLIDALFSTNGVFPHHASWQDHLSVLKPAGALSPGPKGRRVRKDP